MIKGSFFLVEAIFLMMAVSVKSLGIGLLGVIFNIVPILATCGLWAIISGTVGFSIAIVGAVAIGLVIDDTVHLISKFMQAYRHKGKSFHYSILYAYDVAGKGIFSRTIKY